MSERAMTWALELVSVPVADVEQAKRFYHEQVGFAVDHDTRISETMRIVQLTPSGSACSIAISSGMHEIPAGSAQGMQLVVDDIEAARSHLLANGVDVSPVRHFADGAWRDGHGGRWNAFLFFEDPDGNGWVVQERHAGE